MAGLSARSGQEPTSGSAPQLAAILASAGGLEPIRELIGQLHGGLGGSLLVLQHHPVDQPTALPALLAPLTDLPVRFGQAGEPLKPGDIVIVSGGMVVREQDGRTILARPQPMASHMRPGDQLFQSVAAVSGSRSVGIVLSGTGRDGTEGLRAIRAAGGATLAQDPATALHPGMPRNAIEAGLVECVLAPAELARELQERLRASGQVATPDPAGSIQEVCDILARHTGQDFRGYKQGTLLRRTLRRTRVCGCASIAQYARHLERTPEEASLLLGLESVNEELRSSNEELQTSQEELRSVNEELVTINRELNEKNQELLEANSDLQNLFAATDIATIFLDTGLRILRFTPAATGLFSLRPGDTGRPIQDLAPRLANLDLPALARAVLADQEVRSQQVRSLDGRRWFTVRCLPYRGPNQTVDGVVATFVDCTEIQLALEAVADRDERLLKIQMGAKAGTWDLELGSGRITWSAGFFRLLGLDPGQEPSLELWKSVVHPEDAARILPGLPVLLAAGKPYEHEYRVLHPDGTVTWVLTLNSIELDAQGQPVRLAGIALDISVRKAMEIRAVDSEERLEEALRRSHTGAWAWELATRKAYRSAEHARIMGQDAVTDPWSHDRFIEILHPDDRERITRGIREAIAEGREWDLEARIRRPDGAERWIRVAGGSAGASSPGGWVSGIVQDITDRKIVELERMQSEARFSAAFQASPDALVITEAGTGAYVLVNEGFTRMMGLSNSQVIGRTSVELGIWLDLEDRRRHLESVHAGNRAGPVEAQFRLPDGTTLVGEISSRLFQMDERLCILSIIRDVTQARQDQEARRLLESEMVQLQKMESLGRLAGGVAHDMNNVLASIFAVSQILRLSVGADPELDADLASLERAAARGRDLVKALVGFSRKDSGTFAAIDLNDMARREKELLDRTLLQKHQVLTDLQDGLPVVMGNAGTLGSALMNLCVNAVDAMPGGGTLTLRTRKLPGGMVQLEVDDTGEGMAPEVLARAIEPFFTTKAQGKGTGLGLAQVYNAVRNHGGQLNLASQVGIGTCARITLPSTSTELQAVRVEPAASPAAGLDVLFVDDDDLLRRTAPRMLELLGCRVRTADDGTGALQILRDGWRPDLVILDMNMPGLNGLQVLEEIRTFLPHIPVVLATGFTDANITKALEADPRLRVTYKPFTLSEIQAQFHEVEPLLERPVIDRATPPDS